jgi:hypothetical protein
MYRRIPITNLEGYQQETKAKMYLFRLCQRVEAGDQLHAAGVMFSIQTNSAQKMAICQETAHIRNSGRVSAEKYKHHFPKELKI